MSNALGTDQYHELYERIFAWWHRQQFSADKTLVGFDLGEHCWVPTAKAGVPESIQSLVEPQKEQTL